MLQPSKKRKFLTPTENPPEAASTTGGPNTPLPVVIFVPAT